MGVVADHRHRPHLVFEALDELAHVDDTGAGAISPTTTTLRPNSWP